MANLNLSQFTEKTFVADADWTFVWDTAGLISKKVSRNNWLNSGELTTSAPVTISQTWNALAQTFKAFVVNAAGTSDANSAVGSLLLDLQVGGVSKLSVLKNGDLSIRNTGQIGTPNFLIGNSPCSGIYFASGDLRLYVDAASAKFAMSSATTSVKIGSNYSFGWSGGADASQTLDTILVRDGAPNTLALRNSTAAQTFNVYGTYTSGSVYERLTLSAPSAANAIIGTNKGSGGGTARGLDLHTDGAARWTISTAGHLLGAADNSYDIGASGANRPRNVYVANSIVCGFLVDSQYFRALASGGFQVLGRFFISSTADGNITLTNNASTDFGRLQFGGTTDSFPAIARDGAGIKFTGAAAGSTAWVKVPPVAVSALPLAATAGVGARAFVNDATAPVFGSAVTGGGSVPVPVYSTGSAWNVG